MQERQLEGWVCQWLRFREVGRERGVRFAIFAEDDAFGERFGLLAGMGFGYVGGLGLRVRGGGGGGGTEVLGEELVHGEEGRIVKRVGVKSGAGMGELD